MEIRNSVRRSVRNLICSPNSPKTLNYIGRKLSCPKMNPEKVEENTKDRGRKGEGRNKILSRKECNFEMVLPWLVWGGKGTGRFDLRQEAARPGYGR